MSTAPVIIVSGYLGAGKTTFINRILSRGTPGVWVLVNDFGAVNVDASLIRNTHGTTMELTNGCICCAFDDDLPAMLRTAAAASPTMVVIETSGVADPGSLVPHTLTPGFRPGGTVVVADGIETERLVIDRLVGRTVARQLAAADLVLVTKTPVTDGIRTAVRRHNPHAPVVDDAAVDLAGLVLLPHATTDGHVDNPHGEHVERPRVSTTSQALDWLRSLGPDVVRVKGILELDGRAHLVERTGRSQSVTPVDAAPTDGVVVISVRGG